MASTSIEDALGSKLKAPLAPHVEWSFTGTDSKAQSLATTVSDDCSKAAYFRLCEDVDSTMTDLIAGVDDLVSWKDNIISLVDLPKNILTGLMVAVSKLCRVKSTLRILLNDIGLIELTRALAGGVLQDAEIKRLKSLSVQSRSQLDVEEMRTMETERKLRASLAQTICLRSRHRITRWNVMTQKLLGRERKRHFGRKVKTLREHTLLLKKMLAHANTKIRKMANKALTDTNGFQHDSESTRSGRIRYRQQKYLDDETLPFTLEHKETYGYVEVMNLHEHSQKKIKAVDREMKQRIKTLEAQVDELKTKISVQNVAAAVSSNITLSLGSSPASAGGGKKVVKDTKDDTNGNASKTESFKGSSGVHPAAAYATSTSCAKEIQSPVADNQAKTDRNGDGNVAQGTSQSQSINDRDHTITDNAVGRGALSVVQRANGVVESKDSNPTSVSRVFIDDKLRAGKPKEGWSTMSVEKLDIGVEANKPTQRSQSAHMTKRPRNHRHRRPSAKKPNITAAIPSATRRHRIRRPNSEESTSWERKRATIDKEKAEHETIGHRSQYRLANEAREELEAAAIAAAKIVAAGARPSSRQQSFVMPLPAQGLFPSTIARAQLLSRDSVRSSGSRHRGYGESTSAAAAAVIAKAEAKKTTGDGIQHGRRYTNTGVRRSKASPLLRPAAAPPPMNRAVTQSTYGVSTVNFSTRSDFGFKSEK